MSFLNRVFIIMNTAQFHSAAYRRILLGIFPISAELCGKQHREIGSWCFDTYSGKAQFHGHAYHKQKTKLRKHIS